MLMWMNPNPKGLCGMPKSALPEHIDEPSEWEGTDWDWWGQRWMLKIKGWFAYGPRATEWWAKWRPVPKDLININATRKEVVANLEYTSVIQYYTRWHFLLQWPFHVSFHYYWDGSFVPMEGTRPKNLNILQMIFIRFGARFDNDQVYWFPSLFVGGDHN